MSWRIKQGQQPAKCPRASRTFLGFLWNFLKSHSKRPQTPFSKLVNYGMYFSRNLISLLAQVEDLIQENSWCRSSVSYYKAKLEWWDIWFIWKEEIGCFYCLFPSMACFPEDYCQILHCLDMWVMEIVVLNTKAMAFEEWRMFWIMHMGKLKDYHRYWVRLHAKGYRRKGWDASGRPTIERARLHIHS